MPALEIVEIRPLDAEARRRPGHIPVSHPEVVDEHLTRGGLNRAPVERVASGFHPITPHARKASICTISTWAPVGACGPHGEGRFQPFQDAWHRPATSTSPASG